MDVVVVVVVVVVADGKGGSEDGKEGSGGSGGNGGKCGNDAIVLDKKGGRGEKNFLNNMVFIILEVRVLINAVLLYKHCLVSFLNYLP